MDGDDAFSVVCVWLEITSLSAVRKGIHHRHHSDSDSRSYFLSPPDRGGTSPRLHGDYLRVPPDRLQRLFFFFFYFKDGVRFSVSRWLPRKTHSRFAGNSPGQSPPARPTRPAAPCPKRPFLGVLLFLNIKSTSGSSVLMATVAKPNHHLPRTGPRPCRGFSSPELLSYPILSCSILTPPSPPPSRWAHPAGRQTYARRRLRLQLQKNSR
jgi:hypothetical protein